MRSRCCFACVFFLLLSFLCACGQTPQSVVLTPFSADCSFASGTAEFTGVFTLKDSKTMQLMLRTPRELQGLCIAFENDSAVLGFGEATVSLDDAQAIGLPETAFRTLFQALSVFCSAPQTLSENGTAEVSTKNGTASVALLPQTKLPQSVKLGEQAFVFKNQQALLVQ